MNKEDTAEWRREARRKRNRESAAASRNKVRNRIAELEDEVLDWKTKCDNLFERIDALEKMSANANAAASARSVPVAAPASVSVAANELSPCPTNGAAINTSDLVLDAFHVPFNLSLPSFDLASTSSSNLPSVPMSSTFSTQVDVPGSDLNFSRVPVPVDVDVASLNQQAVAVADMALSASVSTSVNVPVPVSVPLPIQVPVPACDEFHVIEMTSRPA